MKALLICAAALLYVLGWLAGMVANIAIWCWSGIAAGWDDAREAERRYTAAQLEQSDEAELEAGRDLVRTR